jgi:phosphatidylserine/phosphatidylglycerophosphate/cardiolipin synthase-like enzyme
MAVQKRKSIHVYVMCLGVAGLFFCGWASQATVSESMGGGDKAREIDVLFSPDGGCEDRIVEEIDKAKKVIRVQMYFFTSKPIADALLEARKRGVKVEVILDKSQEKMTYGRFRVLRRAGVSVYFDGEHATANNKIVLIDRRTVITGSYNFTKAAEERNAENVLIIKGEEDVLDRYLANFKAHRDHSSKHSN